jgi:putative flippase GtrA
MSALFKRLIDLPLFKFLLTGVLNTLVGLSVIYLLMWLLAIPAKPANLIGYAVGIVFSYQVNSRWTFGYREALWPVLPRYALVVVLAYLANLACLRSLLEWRVNAYVAQALALPPYTAIGFLGMRFWVFNKK